MADLSTITVEGVKYNIKDSGAARKPITNPPINVLMALTPNNEQVYYSIGSGLNVSNYELKANLTEKGSDIYVTGIKQDVVNFSGDPQSQLNSKQNILTAGDNITIENNVISSAAGGFNNLGVFCSNSNNMIVDTNLCQLLKSHNAVFYIYWTITATLGSELMIDGNTDSVTANMYCNGALMTSVVANNLYEVLYNGTNFIIIRNVTTGEYYGTSISTANSGALCGTAISSGNSSGGDGGSSGSSRIYCHALHFNGNTSHPSYAINLFSNDSTPFGIVADIQNEAENAMACSGYVFNEDYEPYYAVKVLGSGLSCVNMSGNYIFVGYPAYDTTVADTVTIYGGI